MGNTPGNLHGRGREGAKTPNLYADLPSAPFSVQAGKEWSVRGKDHVTWKLRALCADLLVPGRLDLLKYTYLTLPKLNQTPQVSTFPNWARKPKILTKPQQCEIWPPLIWMVQIVPEPIFWVDPESGHENVWFSTCSMCYIQNSDWGTRIGSDHVFQLT